jgi:poly(A) polymerase
MLNRNESAAETIIQQGLINTDARIAENKPVTPAFIYAVILWPVVKRIHKEILDSGVPEIPALHQAAERVLRKQQLTVAIPKRFSLPMRDIWELQSRLTRRTGKRAELLLDHRYFRAGFDFLLLREQAGEIKPGLGQWWLAFQEAHIDTRGAMLSQIPASDDNTRTARRRRSPRKPK